MQRAKNTDKYFKGDNGDEDEDDIEDSDDDEEIDMSRKITISKQSNKSNIDINRTSDDEDEDIDSDDDDDGDMDDDDINLEEMNDESDDINDNTAESNGLIQDFNSLINDDSDDENDSDENYLQKIDSNFKNNIITEHHPELSIHNYDEVDIMSRVVRDKNGNIIDPLHRTLPFITKYERARIIGERAQQLNAGALPFVVVDPNIIDGYLIALKEFESKKIPFIIKRPIPNGGVEYWKVSDLEII